MLEVRADGEEVLKVRVAGQELERWKSGLVVKNWRVGSKDCWSRIRAVEVRVSGQELVCWK